MANITQKIYAKYILIIQLFAKIYFIYFDIYVTYKFFHVGYIYFVDSPTAFGVWEVSGVRRSPKSSSLALGQYLDG